MMERPQSPATFQTPIKHSEDDNESLFATAESKSINMSDFQHASTYNNEPPSNPFYTTNQQSIGINKNTTPLMSTSGLLYGLSGLQTTTNTKLDVLTNAIFSLTKSIDRLYSEQLKQTELLTMIARNTSMAHNYSVTPPSNTPMNSKSNTFKVKDFGFTNNIDIMSDLILKLIRQVEIQISNRNKQYKSTRDLNIKVMKQVIKAAVNNNFKINDEIESHLDLPDNKTQSTLKVASKLGSIDGTSPVLTPEAFRELFDDVDCRVFTALVEKIIERLCILRILLPYYEADILAAISYPYFNKSGEVMCDWNKLRPRSETALEAAVASTTLENRNKIASMLAKGISEKAVIRSVLKLN